MAFSLNVPSPLHPVNYDLFAQNDIRCFIKRDDQIHTEISGNKWRKLKLNIAQYEAGKYEKILSFGGAYSNHISALAALGKELEIPTIGIIRGEELNPQSNETLERAHAAGMELVFVSREEYSWRYETSYKHELRRKFGNVLAVPEGGANFYGVMGCTEIVSEIDFEPDYYVLATGTGTTTAGILMATNRAKVLSVPVFKKGGFIRDEVKELLACSGLGEEELDEKMEQLELATDFAFGGYGKYTEELIEFINDVYRHTNIPLDQIYTGKMFYALCSYIQTGKIPSGSKVVVIHTGGLQGTSSVKSKLVF